MKMVSTRFTHATGAASRFALAAMMVIAAVLGTTADMAQAQNTTQLTAPIIQVTRVRPDVAELTITNVRSTIGVNQQYQVISGPNAVGSLSGITRGLTVLVGVRDAQSKYPIQLLPDSEYVVQVRNIKTSANFSAWTTVSFRTAAQFETRPNSPPNLRIINQTATQVTLRWDAPSGAAPFIYDMFLNDVRTVLPQCVGGYGGCTEVDFRTVTINRPAPGTSLKFGVTARDTNLNLSLPTELTISS
jgi:hypothetical protein